MGGWGNKRLDMNTGDCQFNPKHPILCLNLTKPLFCTILLLFILILSSYPFYLCFFCLLISFFLILVLV